MKGSVSLDLNRKKRLYQDSQPLLVLNREKQKRKAFDAASEFFKKYKGNPLTDTLQSIFGTQFFARAAMLLDPLTDFRNTAGIITYESRYRQRNTFSTEVKSVWDYSFVRSQTYYDEQLTPVPEYTTHEEAEVLEDLLIEGSQFFDYCWDSTRKSRSWENSEFMSDAFEPGVPSYGRLTFDKQWTESSHSANAFFKADTEIFFPFGSDNDFLRYIKEKRSDRVFIDGTCTSFSGDIYLSDLPAFAYTFMNENISNMIVQAVADKRVFNPFYVAWELRELPRIVKSIRDLQTIISNYVRKPHTLADLDKDISNLYLAWQFGVKSTYDSLKDLMKLPEKATKRLNYLIRRNGKVTTGRSTRKWLNFNFEQELPAFEFHLPPWVTVESQSVKRTVDIELRCVVNSTIQFPQLAVPSITDKDYQRLLGLRPSAEDIWNVIPFTWLIDWFGGLGAYIDIMSTIHSDRQLLNYGFLTIVISEKVYHTAELRVSDHYYSYYADESDNTIVVDDTTTDRIVPYQRTYCRKYQQRVSIGDLDGVKTFGFGHTNLSDFQTSILGALVTQRSEKIPKLPKLK